VHEGGGRLAAGGWRQGEEVLLDPSTKRAVLLLALARLLNHASLDELSRAGGMAPGGLRSYSSRIPASIQAATALRTAFQNRK